MLSKASPRGWAILGGPSDDVPEVAGNITRFEFIFPLNIFPDLARRGRAALVFKSWF